mmetsp:Transcript_12463/g.16349  ORF Transcript_12463/g.16349 Transcript_12463/m.16349 type:complete len:101 (-) Transcript_12463:13-315(-)
MELQGEGTADSEALSSEDEDYEDGLEDGEIEEGEIAEEDSPPSQQQEEQQQELQPVKHSSQQANEFNISYGQLDDETLDSAYQKFLQISGLVEAGNQGES